MKEKSIKKNYIYNLGYQILLLLTPLITTPYLSRVFGADGIGTVSYSEANVSYFVLFGTLGITIFGQREIAFVRDNTKIRSRMFWEIKVLELITASIALIAYVIFALLQKNNRYIYLCMTLNIIAIFFDVTWFFQGLEEFGKIVLRNLVFKVINIAYIFLFIRTRNDIALYVFGIAFFSVLSNISLWFYLPKYIEKNDWREIHPLRNIKEVLTLFIPTIACQICAVLDKTMIGLFTQNSYENGYYEQAMKICRITLTVVTALGTVMIPRIGYLYGKGENEQVKKYMYRGYRFVWFIGIPLCLGVNGISNNFVPWFFGDGYEKVELLLDILSFLIVANGISHVTGVQYLIPTKREGIFTKTVFGGAVINTFLNISLIGTYMSVGAAMASILAEAAIAIIQLVILRRELSIKIILLSSVKYILAGSIMLSMLKMIGNYLTPSIIHTIILILIGMIVYFAVLLIMRDAFFMENTGFIYNRITSFFSKTGDEKK